MRIYTSLTIIIGMIIGNQIVGGNSSVGVQTITQPGTSTAPLNPASTAVPASPQATLPTPTNQPVPQLSLKQAEEKAVAPVPAQVTSTPPAPASPVPAQAASAQQGKPTATGPATQSFGPIAKEEAAVKKEEAHGSVASKVEAKHAEKKAEEKKAEEHKMIAQPQSVQQPKIQSPTPVAVPVQKVAMPTPAKVVPSAPLPPEEQPVGIDTVNVESASGNWLLKRIWFERAQENYEKIKALFDRVLELRVALFTKRAELERTLFEPFYVHSGIGQGELLEVLSRLLQEVEQFRRESGAFSEEEHELFSNIEREKTILDQLQKDVTAITDIDNALEAAVLKLVEQVNVSRSYEKQAWEAFKEIGRQLSDKKARDLYYTMDTYRKNIADIITYIQGDFGRHVMDLEREAKTQIDRVTTTIKDLKQKGIDFKEQAHRIEQRRQQREKAQHTEEEEEELGYWDSFWSYMGNKVSSFYQWIWPSAEEEEEATEPHPKAESKAAQAKAKEQKAVK
jgi:hypothetical protein